MPQTQALESGCLVWDPGSFPSWGCSPVKAKARVPEPKVLSAQPGDPWALPQAALAGWSQ